MGEVNRMDIEGIVKERTRERKQGDMRDEKTQMTQKQTHTRIDNLFNGHLTVHRFNCIYSCI